MNTFIKYQNFEFSKKLARNNFDKKLSTFVDKWGFHMPIHRGMWHLTFLSFYETSLTQTFNPKKEDLANTDFWPANIVFSRSIGASKTRQNARFSSKRTYFWVSWLCYKKVLKNWQNIAVINKLNAMETLWLRFSNSELLEFS